MKQPWIHSQKIDSLFILSPSFLVVGMVFLLQDKIALIQNQYSFYTWLFLIVFIDVAHVYATLFKTYFVTETFQKKKKLLIVLPIICFLVGMILFLFGSLMFWSFLAYIAVFHFIRQQYGFMRLYARNENKTTINIYFDNITIYTATIYPMLFWFFSSDRKFNWFVENEFFKFDNKPLLSIIEWVYWLIICIYIVRTAYIYIKTKEFNIPKNAIIVGTFLSWYVGIVWFNNDLVFTLLNVVSHGIPYMALVYVREIELRPNPNKFFLKRVSRIKALVIFFVIILIFAISEEFLWESLIWKEQISIASKDFSSWHFLLVPLLTVPQFTHYLLDGFIWKSK